MSTILRYFEYSLLLLFFGIGMKTELFQSCCHCWVFQICWHIECNTVTPSSFQIWNNWNSITSTLFVVMLPETHLTSHSRMSDSRWVITLLWLSGSLRLFCIVLLCILVTSSYLLLLLVPYFYCPFISADLFFFKWRIFALQNFMVFCHTSTRISHRYTHVLSLPNPPFISIPIPPF